jgi:hypothetical protein
MQLSRNLRDGYVLSLWSKIAILKRGITVPLQAFKPLLNPVSKQVIRRLFLTRFVPAKNK